MSFPEFKDFAKNVADFINDDFDSKYTLKIKSCGPAKTTITTTVQLNEKDGKGSLKPKVSLKYPHESGFTLEKLEVSPDCKLVVETSLSGTVDGLKIDFKGNDSEKSDVSFKYVVPAATITGELDLSNFAKAETSVFAGHGAFGGGVLAKFSKDDSSANKLPAKVSVDVALSHTVPKVCFTALKAKDNFTSYSALFGYTQLSQATFAGSVDYSPKKTVGVLAGAYDVDTLHTLKAKANTDGVFSASLKKKFDKKFTVVGSVETSNLKSFKWGLNATLG